MRWTVAAVILATLTLVSAAYAEQSARIITTNGQATVYATPDKVVVSLGIEDFGKDLDAVKTENDTTSNELLKAIKAMGIEDKDIQTTQMSEELVYENYNQPVEGIQGYKTNRSFSVTLNDAKQLSKLIDTALKNGANQLLGFQYDTDAMRALRDQARAMAVRAAKEKAAAMAKELDCKPGRPVTITESQPEWGYDPMSSNSNAVAVRPGDGNFSGQSMPTGRIPITATVSVSFELEDLP